MNYNDLLKEMSETHEKKARDYSQPGNPFSNFEFAAELSARFINPIDRVFATIIGIKLARLIELQGKPAVNESVTDTHKDLTIYCSLWWQFREYHKPTQRIAEAYKGLGNLHPDQPAPNQNARLVNIGQFGDS